VRGERGRERSGKGVSRVRVKITLWHSASACGSSAVNDCSVWRARCVRRGVRRTGVGGAERVRTQTCVRFEVRAQFCGALS
jgi:hypothetical protein